MDLHEVGAYMFLLCMAWQSERHGYLADDDDKLRRWARMSRDQWSQSRESLLAKFPVVEDGWRANPRMVHEALKQRSFSESQSAKGMLGGRPKKAERKPELSNEKPEHISGISPEKPSVSVSAFVSKEQILSSTSSTQAPPAASPTAPDSPPNKQRKPSPEHSEIVRQVFDYYIENLGRDPKRYTLTRKRSQRAHDRLKHCLRLSNGDPQTALTMMCDAVDGLVANNWLMGRDPKSNGKRYIEFDEHIFHSDDVMEKRWEDFRGKQGVS